LLLLKTAHGGMVQFNPIESLFNAPIFGMEEPSTNETMRLHPDPNEPTPEEREAERIARRQRMRERNERVKEAIKYMRPDTVERLSEEEVERLEGEHPSLRQLSWSLGGNKAVQFADPGEDYDMWSQAYRMLGGFIDCDHKIHQGGSHDNNNNADDKSCSRWMLWASVRSSVAAMETLPSECWLWQRHFVSPSFFNPYPFSTLIPITKVTVTTNISETVPLES